MDYIYLILVLASLMLYSLLPFFWLSRHILRIRYGNHMGTGAMDATLVAVFVLLALVIYALASDFISSKTELPPYASALGWVLIAGSLALEAWSLYLLAKTANPKKGFDTLLVTSGPYAYVRHPVYLAHTALNFGIYLATGAYIPLLVFAEWVLMLRPLADTEDEELELRMEENYLKYRKNVPQLIPKLR